MTSRLHPSRAFHIFQKKLIDIFPKRKNLWRGNFDSHILSLGLEEKDLRKTANILLKAYQSILIPNESIMQDSLFLLKQSGMLYQYSLSISIRLVGLVCKTHILNNQSTKSNIGSILTLCSRALYLCNLGVFVSKFHWQCFAFDL